MGQITVFSGSVRLRRWSGEEGVQILVEAFSPGACVARVARRHDDSRALIYTWRRKLCQPGAEPGFAEAIVVAGDDAEPPATPPAIVVELAGGSRGNICASALDQRTGLMIGSPLGNLALSVGQ